MESICCGIVLTALWNVTTFISIQRVAYIFGRDFVLLAGESNHSFSLFQHTPKTFNKVKVRRPIHVWKWLLVLPDTHVSSCSTLSQLEPDESWHCRLGLSHQWRKRSIDGITWSFTIFRNSADLTGIWWLVREKVGRNLDVWKNIHICVHLPTSR